MSHVDKSFIDLIGDVRSSGRKVNPRNGERMRLFEPNKIRFNSTPLVSVRKTAWKSAIREFEWFMSGSNIITDLHESVRKWWEPWATNGVYVENNYSSQFRHWQYTEFGGRSGSFDQIQAFIDGIKEKPHSARHVITTWNTADMYSPDTKITNCHGTKIQAVVHDGVLDLSMDQRSADLICGVPHNWIQYWAFLLWLSHRTGNKPGQFIWDGGDVHIYAAHYEMSGKIMYTDVDSVRTPQLVYTPTSEDFKADDFSLDGPYTPIITDSVEMVV